jgi:hypothetical protein
MTSWKTQQRNVLKAWRKLLWDFTKREWLSLFVWSGFGALAAGLVRLVLWDASFQAFLTSNYMPSASFRDRRLLFPYLITVAVAFFLGIALRIPGFFWRGLRSWWAGVTSGLALFPFTSTFVLLTVRSSSIRWRLMAAFGIVAASFWSALCCT